MYDTMLLLNRCHICCIFIVLSAPIHNNYNRIRKLFSIGTVIIKYNWNVITSPNPCISIQLINNTVNNIIVKIVYIAYICIISDFTLISRRKRTPEHVLNFTRNMKICKHILTHRKIALAVRILQIGPFLPWWSLHKNSKQLLNLYVWRLIYFEQIIILVPVVCFRLQSSVQNLYIISHTLFQHQGYYI